MSCKSGKKLKRLVDIVLNKNLFSKKLPSSIFKSFLEVLKNAFNRKLNDCFDSKTRKKLKKHKKLIVFLLNGKKDLKKRKRRFLNASSSFQSAIETLLCNFLGKCLTFDNESVCETASNSEDS